MTGLRRVIILSGYPASGKTTLGRALAERLGLALVAKDALLDVMYEAAGGQPGDPELSLKTGRAAWAAFWHLSRTCPQVVLDSNIRPEGEEERIEMARIEGPPVGLSQAGRRGDVATRRYRRGGGSDSAGIRESGRMRLSRLRTPVNADIEPPLATAVPSSIG